MSNVSHSSRQNVSILFSFFILSFSGLKSNLVPAVTRRCSVKKSVLENFAMFTGQHWRQSHIFSKVAGLYNYIKKEIPAPVFSCDFREICKNTLLNRTLVVAASVSTIYYDSRYRQKQTDYVQRFLIKLLKPIKELLSK